MHKKAIAVGDLQYGMYVTELDRPWTETPFAFQGFALSNERQLQALRKFCKHVYIDTARSDARAVVPRPPAQGQPAAPSFALHGKAAYAPPKDLAREIETATLVYSRSCEALEELLEPLQRGAATLAGAEVTALVGKLAESVIRNPDALLLLSKVREIQTPAHARALQVAVYMMVFGRFLQREADEIRLLGLLGLLQDVGMTRLPAALVLKHGPLTAEEGEMMKRHVELSAHILELTSGLPPKFANLALLHHERQDGAGYPRGLRGYQIGLPGAIAAICDTYEALLAPPPYGEGKPPAEAVKLLVKERGTAFHGPLLEQFIRCMGAFPIGTTVELTSGEYGVVVAEHLMQRLKPKVLVLVDRDHKVLRSGKLVDLAAEEAPRIRRTLEQGQLAFDPRRLL
jgi:HD-GYP domain-containing protein (c-di-GMP phosphodiesterase class II)